MRLSRDLNRFLGDLLAESGFKPAVRGVFLDRFSQHLRDLQCDPDVTRGFLFRFVSVSL